MKTAHLVRGLARTVVFATVTAWYVARIIVGAPFAKDQQARAIRLRKQLSLSLMSRLSIVCHVKGTLPKHGALVVSNHRSYIDSVAIFHLIEACPVVKAEVASWPLIGLGLRHSATVFVRRSDAESRARTRREVAAFLSKGVSVVVFVEGTTYIGPRPGEFRPGTFQMAAEGGFPVVPVALEYRIQDMAWVGSDTFIPHFIKVFGTYARIECTVSFGTEISGNDGLALRDAAHVWVSEKLGLLRRRYDESL